MYQPVTVEARSHHFIGPRRRPLSCNKGLETELVKGDVALPAQPERRGLQQAGICAAVGLMAVEAVLHHGRVLKNRRAPILCVTRKAKLSIGKPPYELR